MPDLSSSSAKQPIQSLSDSANQAASTKKWGWLVLFTALPTLTCCALPLLLVSLGFGSVVAAMFNTIPGLAFLAGNKIWMFGISGLLIAAASYMVFVRPQACPANKALAEQCMSAKVWNKRLLVASAIIWSIGFFSSYIFPYLIEYFGL